MSEQWDGRPQNPERDGWHWLQFNDDCPIPTAWIAEIAAWASCGAYSPEGVVELGFRYLGPCLTPAEVAALTAQRDDWVEQARKAMDDAEAREAAARREGIEAAAHAAEHCLHPSAERTAHAAVDDAVAAIRALLEDER